MVQAARPFYEFFGGKNVRLLQNVDDPSRFTQVIEYETDADIELNRQQLASDPRWQASLKMWRSVVSGAIDIDIYSDVTKAGLAPARARASTRSLARTTPPSVHPAARGLHRCRAHARSIRFPCAGCRCP